MTPTRDELERLADHHGMIRTDSSLVRADLMRAVRAGLLVRIDYRTFCLPHGG